jgi:hypothetical protein
VMLLELRHCWLVNFDILNDFFNLRLR